VNGVGSPADGIKCRGIDGKIKNGGKTDCPQHPEVILGKAGRRFSNGSDHPVVKVRDASYVIRDTACLRLHEEPVYREISAKHVLPGIGIADPGRSPAVHVPTFNAIGRYFERQALLYNHDDAESGPQGHRPGKKGLHILRRCGGDDVDVFRVRSEKEIADAAAHEKDLVARRPQPSGDGESNGSQPVLLLPGLFIHPCPAGLPTGD
jgi:hypothetical protein